MLNLFEFFTEKGQFSRRALIVLIISSGISGGFLLAVLNAAAAEAANKEVQLRYLMLFLLTLLLFAMTKKIALVRATIAGERAIRETRVRLANKIRRSELLFVEQVGHGDLYARLTQDTATISQAVPMIFNGYQSAVLLFCGLIYVATVSLIAFVITSTFLALGGYAYVLQSRRIVANLKQATKKEAQFFDALKHLVDGFKEIKINYAKNDDVHLNVSRIAEETEHLMVNTGQHYVTHLVGSQVMLFLLIAAVVFVLPVFDYAPPNRILELTSAGLFIVAPLEVIFTSYYFYNKAAVALKNINELEKRLDTALENQTSPHVPDIGMWGDFKEITLRNIQFNYPGAGVTYGIGPLDLTIARNTITFITGGNGSGKSTLLKVLMQLYPPTSGEIRVDGRLVDPVHCTDYRELFAGIFGDFHLFDRLYGVRDADPQAVRKLLLEMDIADKTTFADNVFTNLDLSTGQRKRLAMVIARLEAKPIYVFDEWAADQDPQFRRYFYEALLPALKAEGKTIIAVTHDDAYFHCADKRMKLDYGRVVEMA